MTADAFAYVSGPDVVVAVHRRADRPRHARRRGGARARERRRHDRGRRRGRSDARARRAALATCPSNHLDDPPLDAYRRPGRPRLRARRGGRARRARPRRTTCATVINDVLDERLVPRAARRRTRPTWSPGSGGSTGGPSASSPTSRCTAPARLDIEAAQKAARFVQWCDASTSRSSRSSTPAASSPGRDLEWRGMIRHGAELVHAYAEATVPRLCVVLRKAYGGAYIVMDSKNLGNDWCIAWPTAEIAVMGAPGAVQILYRRDLARDRRRRRAARASSSRSRPSTRSASPTRTSPPSAATSTTSSPPPTRGASSPTRCCGSAPSASSTADRRHSNTPL